MKNQSKIVHARWNNDMQRAFYSVALANQIGCRVDIFS